jgi:hypothetical protein
VQWLHPLLDPLEDSCGPGKMYIFQGLVNTIKSYLLNAPCFWLAR